jgi:hypothetical protein
VSEMKSNFTKKKRVVAITHFALTIIAWFLTAGNFWVFWVAFLAMLQPVLFLLYEIGKVKSFFDSIPEWTSISLFLFLSATWSFCFGWLYVKFTNWLNHFPVLGKKVF